MVIQMLGELEEKSAISTNLAAVVDSKSDKENGAATTSKKKCVSKPVEVNSAGASEGNHGVNDDDDDDEDDDDDSDGGKSTGFGIFGVREEDENLGEDAEALLAIDCQSTSHKSAPKEHRADERHGESHDHAGGRSNAWSEVPRTQSTKLNRSVSTAVPLPQLWHAHQFSAKPAPDTRRARLGYWADQLFESSFYRVAFMMAFLAIAIGLGGVFLWAADAAPSPAQGMWTAWTFMADPGTHATARGPLVRFVAASVSLVGIFLFAACLGLVVEAIQKKMKDLEAGLSRVVESDHSLVLGFTDKTVNVIEELALANDSDGGGVIVVLADVPKAKMEGELQIQAPQLRGTKVVFRSGSPMLVHDLAKVGADKARSILILANSGDPDKADAETLRSVLALMSFPMGLSGHIVAEMRDIDNEPLVQLVGGTFVETIVSHDVLGRLMLMR